MSKIRCPQCNAECDPGEPSCPACGRYLGVRRREPVVPPEPDPDEDERFGIPRPVWWLMNMFPGVFAPTVLIMSIVAVVVAGMLTWLALFMLVLGAAFAGFAIGAAGMICYWAAIAWLMYGALAAPSEVLSEFDSTKWTVFILLAMLPVVGTAIIIGRSP
jgi:hypothetical protein